MRAVNLFFCTVLLLSAIGARARDLGCSTPDRWAAKMAFGYLKTAGLTTNAEIDFSKTSVKLLAQEKIGKDLYSQVHLVTFTKKPEDLVTLARRSSDQIQVITLNKASSQECSMSAVDVYVISQHLGGQ